MGQNLGAKTATSSRAQGSEYRLGPLLPLFFSQWVTAEPHLPRSTSKIPGRSGPSFTRVIVFPRSQWSGNIVYALRSVVSVFPRPVCSSCTRVPMASKVRMLWGLLLLMTDSQVGSLTRGSELSILCENLCGIYFPVCGLPPSRYGIWLYCKGDHPTVLLDVQYLLDIESMDAEYLFWMFQPCFADGCSAVSRDSDVSMGRAELKSFYPTILHLISSLQCSPSDNSVRGSQPWAAHRNHGKVFNIPLLMPRLQSGPIRTSVTGIQASVYLKHKGIQCVQLKFRTTASGIRKSISNLC